MPPWRKSKLDDSMSSNTAERPLLVRRGGIERRSAHRQNRRQAVGHARPAKHRSAATAIRFGRRPGGASSRRTKDDPSPEASAAALSAAAYTAWTAAARCRQLTLFPLLGTHERARDVKGLPGRAEKSLTRTSHHGVRTIVTVTCGRKKLP